MSLLEVSAIRGGPPNSPLRPELASPLWSAAIGSELYVLPDHPLALILDNYIEEILPRQHIAHYMPVIIKLVRLAGAPSGKPEVLVYLSVPQANIFCRPFLEYRQIGD